MRAKGGFARGVHLLAAAAVAAAAVVAMVSDRVEMGAISGRLIITETGAASPGSEVYLSGPIDTEGMSINRNRTSDDGGRFLFPKVPPGTYSLSVYSAAHGASGETVHVTANTTTRLQLGLTRDMPDLEAVDRLQVCTTRKPVEMTLAGYASPRAPRNRDRLEMRLLRFDLRNILASPKAWRHAQTLLRYEAEDEDRLEALDAMAAGSGRVVRSWTEDAKEEDVERHFSRPIGLGRLTPGLYVLDVRRGRDRVAFIRQVTDLAMVLKHTATSALAYLVRMPEAIPVEGAEVRLYRGRRPSASGVTNAQGVFQTRLAEGGGTLVAVAWHGPDAALTGVEGFGDERDGKLLTAFYTDRPIYRPGDTANYKVVVRDSSVNGRPAPKSGTSVRFRVIDPRGNTISEAASRTNEYGSAWGEVRLDPENATGYYSVEMLIGGERHAGEFEVTSYRKPEMLVQMEPVKRVFLSTEPAEFRIHARYMEGTPVSGGRVEFTASATDWLPDNEMEVDVGYGEVLVQSAIQLDTAGNGRVRVPRVYDGRPSTSTTSYILCSATAVDGAGRRATGTSRAEVDTGDWMLDLKSVRPKVGMDRKGWVQASAADRAGNPSAGVRLQVTAYHYRDYADTPYNQEPTAKPVWSATVTTGAEGYAWAKPPAPPAPPADGWYLVIDCTDTHGRRLQATKILGPDAANAERRGSEEQRGSYDYGLHFSKPRYRAGDVVRVQSGAGRNGSPGLWTVEGDDLHLYAPAVASGGRLTGSFRLPKEAAQGGARVSLSSFDGDRFAPTSHEIPSARTARRLMLDVAVVGQPSPGQPAKVSVQARDELGRPCAAELSLSVVDEGIHQLRKDKPSILEKTFADNRDTRVRTDYSGESLLLGGDGKSGGGEPLRKRLLDTAFWLPALRTDAEGRATARFVLPDNITKWRCTVIGHTLTGRYGHGLHWFVATKPVHVSLVGPRYLSTGDVGRIVATIRNGQPFEVDGRVDARPTGLALAGGGQRSLRIPARSSRDVPFDVTALQGGTATFDLALEAVGGGQTRADRVRLQLPVRATGSVATREVSVTATPGRAGAASFDVPDPAEAQVTLLVNPSAASVALASVTWLAGYPYGCTEQTSSKLIGACTAIRAKRDARPGRRTIANPLHLRMARSGLARLARMQHASGAWGWWEADGDDGWMTAYALYAIAQARRAGLTPGGGMLDDALRGARKIASRCDGATLSFLRMALAANGKPDLGVKWLATRSDLAAAPVGLASRALQVNASRSIVADHPMEAKLASLARRADGLAWFSEPPAKFQRTASMWSDVSTTALCLSALARSRSSAAVADEAAEWLLTRCRESRWPDTHETALAASALLEWVAARPAGRVGRCDVAVTVNGIRMPDVVMAAGYDLSAPRRITVPRALLRFGANALSVSLARGSRPVRCVLSARTRSDGPQGPVAPGLRVSKRTMLVTQVRDIDGRWVERNTPLPRQIPRGTRLRVLLTIGADRAYDRVLLEDAIPSVLEPMAPQSGGSWAGDATDVRDDRFAAFIDRIEPGVRTFTYEAVAQWPGRSAPARAIVGPMYGGLAPARSEAAAMEVR
ncbi:MAG: MG2 domain-containing protein [Armatimonadetes bacterium]|nr:MG2 domain-containing protein [Armatimonadota bacterium]